MLESILPFTQKPVLYQKSTTKFWDDEHISKGMLSAHLDPEWDAATRKHKFVDRSVDWLASVLPPEKHRRLIDLGCGPGIYAERFYKKSYRVTGIDFSKRSIDHAIASAKEKNMDIDYKLQNYLELSVEGCYDIATLICCDFGALSGDDRKLLLRKIHSILNPDGALVFDAFTPKYYEGKPETKSWGYCDSGFFYEKPHICLDSFYRYDENNTFLAQTIVIGADTVNCHNIWEHTFTEEELRSDLTAAGFSKISFYGDVAGAEYNPDGEILCVIAKKEENTHGSI